MSEAEEINVDPRFEQWYKTVDMGDDPARVKARWQGVVEVYSKVTSKTIVSICQLAFGGTRPTADELAWFEAPFKEIDGSFTIGANDLELRVLAAACVVNELEEVQYTNGSTYLAVASACFSGLRKFAVSFDIKSFVESTIQRLSVEAATRPTQGVLNADPFVFKADVNQQWDSNRDAALKSMADSINTKLGPLRRKVEALSAVINVQDDELQVLWWLFGGKSLERKSVFAKVPVECRPLIFAKELADCVKMAPGPVSIADILAKAGVPSTGKQNVLSAIAAVSDWWGTIAPTKVAPSPLLHPLHYALFLQRQAESGWQQYWASVVKIDVAAELQPLVLAQQFYRERVQLLSA
jgi:hypothetical protein